MPANKYALLRYRIIDRAIKNKYKPFPSKEDLQRACEEELYGSSGDRISQSTIDKDLFAMRNESNLGYYAPIAYNKAEKGYYYEDPEYSIEKLPLSMEDVKAIEFAANTLAQFRGIELFKSSGDAIDKILGRLSLQPEKEKDLQAHVQFETAPVYRGSEYLSILLEGITEKKEVEFYYAKYSGGKQRRYLLHPYLLKEYRNRWYVIGFNPEKEAVVVFGLDRIEGIIGFTGRRFTPSTDFDPDRYFKHSIGITAIDENPERIVLRFSPLTGKYVESQPLHHSQKVIRNDETALVIELFLCITRELVMQILSYGPDVEVISPDRLKQEIKTELQVALARYE